MEKIEMEKIEQPNSVAPESVITLSKDNSAGPMGKKVKVKLWILGLMIAFISIMIIALISVLVIFFVTGSTSTINLDDMISGNGQPCNDNKSCFGNLQCIEGTCRRCQPGYKYFNNGTEDGCEKTESIYGSDCQGHGTICKKFYKFICINGRCGCNRTIHYFDEESGSCENCCHNGIDCIWLGIGMGRKVELCM